MTTRLDLCSSYYWLSYRCALCEGDAYMYKAKIMIFLTILKKDLQRYCLFKILPRSLNTLKERCKYLYNAFFRSLLDLSKITYGYLLLGNMKNCVKKIIGGAAIWKQPSVDWKVCFIFFTVFLANLKIA